MLRTLRLLALLFAALGLGPGLAHVLELPPKMRYDAQTYATVTGTLYRLFGSVGAAIQVGALLLAAGLTLRLRRGRRPGFWLTLAGTLGLALSLVLWALLVYPVNAEWAGVIATSPDQVPRAYERLRPRWEYGHAAAFAAWLAGFVLLLLSVVRETPEEAADHRWR